eukprot:4515201-Prymnesium_polylepis.2
MGGRGEMREHFENCFQPVEPDSAFFAAHPHRERPLDSKVVAVLDANYYSSSSRERISGVCRFVKRQLLHHVQADKVRKGPAYCDGREVNADEACHSGEGTTDVEVSHDPCSAWQDQLRSLRGY